MSDVTVSDDRGVVVSKTARFDLRWESGEKIADAHYSQVEVSGHFVDGYATMRASHDDGKTWEAPVYLRLEGHRLVPRVCSSSKPGGGHCLQDMGHKGGHR